MNMRALKIGTPTTTDTIMGMVAPLSAITSILLMASLPWDTWLRLIIWMAIGLVIYFAYGQKHSKLRNS